MKGRPKKSRAIVLVGGPASDEKAKIKREKQADLVMLLAEPWMTLSRGLAAVNLTYDTYKSWRATDAEFDMACRKAQLVATGKIGKVITREDVLARNPSVGLAVLDRVERNSYRVLDQGDNPDDEKMLAGPIVIRPRVVEKRTVTPEEIKQMMEREAVS